MSLGQFAGLGPLAVWRLSPVGRGIGFAMCTLSTIVAIYYNVVMAYCLHYMFSSFASVLPWEACDPAWALADRYIYETFFWFFMLVLNFLLLHCEKS